MENYGSSSPYPHNNNNSNNNQYPYPYHPNPYRPPNSDPYPPPPPSHQYNAPYYPYQPPLQPYAPPPPPHHHSGPLDYSHHPQPSPSPHSAPLDYHRHSLSYSSSFNYQPQPPYPYPAHQPTLHSHGSFGTYGSSHYSYQEPGQYPPPPETKPQEPPRTQGIFDYHREDNVSSMGLSHENVSGGGGGGGSSYPPVYPPVDELLGSMHISDNRPSAPASLPAPSVPPVSAPPSSSCFGQGRPGEFYRYPNNSFPSNSGLPYLGRVDSSNVSMHGYSSTESPHGPGMQIVPFGKGSLKVLLLHGNLDIWIYDAKNLPNMDMFHKTLGDMFGRLPGNMSNKIEGQLSRKITSDPYVSISVAGAVIGRTYVLSNSENPVWMQHFYVPVAHHAPEVHFVVKDSDVVGSQLIGIVAIPVEQIFSGARIEGTFPILTSNGKPCKPGAVLSLSIQYTPMEKLSVYHHGVGAGPDYYGVPGTYFPLRKGGTMTLYQDAHVPERMLPGIRLDNGMSYEHGKCWHDMFDAIRQARRLIYITGWSVWHKVSLVRDSERPASECTLGELLRSKSQEGVRVLLLVWDDPTSRSILGYKTDGVMATHDEETRRFFKHSSVQVLLCPRIAGKRHSWVKQREVGTIYTHHQKTVIVDADAGGNRRKIIAFVGGLDLCDGRYDTPQHSLFRTLQTVHKDDYHNPTFTGNVSGCPREPWHDLHSKIDGPAAYDVLTNFEERWMKAAKPRGIKKLKMSYDDALLRIERIPDILGVSDVPTVSENDPEAWHVQIFRSIDSNSVKGFPKDPKDATSKNLVCGKNMLIDMSIHTAYVKAIRAAQHFIYIENQYFIGSSYNWNAHKDIGANNLIPMEIALKIAEKIKANERFAAYIVIPMWPEGVPTGAATQRILYWQHKTMQMMYETIYKALVEMGLEGAFTPQDYLNFFCLGNRETVDGIDHSGTGSPSSANTPQVLSKKSRRFMIYVHSKGMVVDDEYVVIGSANINQRSMEGTRDTEIAMGAYQPQHTWARKQSGPRGQIYGYRMSLWAEHMGTLEECFTQPDSLECVRKVRAMGERNWKQFSADEITDMRGHLLKYPVQVDLKGKVRPLPGCESFPDVGGNIVGSFIAIQENLTI
ncbi:PREDICTED: phospholipase D beta 1 [Tarenaya hassleriana]|uniref:phospholipase D beta 1 n=1 Tax=Tarenaya hassleriana TaxID=28532 RepID=UPI00053C0EC2|nr:PREDICTED: phospholipase D beta 1 [Tarenaya hassleriana]